MKRARRGIATHFTLYSYIARDFFFSFFVSFLFFFVIFFINQLLLMAEDILSKQARVWDVALLVIYAMPAIVAMAFPFASLVGALMSVGRFSSENNIIVFQASGFSLRRAFLPLFVLSVVFAVTSFIMNDYFLPAGTINFGKLYRKLLSSTPALELKPYSWKNYDNSTIITGMVLENEIDDLTILDVTEDGKRRVIEAKHAALKESEQRAGVITFDLTDVFMQTTDPAHQESFEYSTSDRMVYNILLKNFMESVTSIGPREMRSTDVESKIAEMRVVHDARVAANRGERISQALRLRALYRAYSAPGSGAITADNAARFLSDEYSTLVQLQKEDLTDKSLQLYELEYYKKFSIPFASVFFVLFAFPVGLFTKKSGRSVGFGVGILVAVIYWVLLIGGQTLGSRTDFSPFWSMWLPDAFVLLLGAVAFVARRIR
jgi:lipopolysaccharide export system permease protein